MLQALDDGMQCMHAVCLVYGNGTPRREPHSARLLHRVNMSGGVIWLSCFRNALVSMAKYLVSRKVDA